MNYLVHVVMLALLSFSANSPSSGTVYSSPLDKQHAATHRIVMENALEKKGCSATAVAPHVLLTAGHCLAATSKILIDDTLVKINNVEFDDADHMLIFVDSTFNAYTPIEQRDLQAKEKVHLWGNPGSSRDIYRDGQYLKNENIEGVDDASYKLFVFQLPIYAGDSGSGVLSEDGKIVSVISLGDQSARAACFPLQFSEKQLASLDSSNTNKNADQKPNSWMGFVNQCEKFIVTYM